MYVRCSSRASCVDSHLDKRWLSPTAWECIRIPPQFVNPVSIAITYSIQVTAGDNRGSYCEDTRYSTSLKTCSDSVNFAHVHLSQSKQSTNIYLQVRYSVDVNEMKVQ